jgi:hypothetical protein
LSTFLHCHKQFQELSHKFQVTYNFQFSFISPELTSILSVKLDIFVHVKLSKTSQEFLFIQFNAKLNQNIHTKKADIQNDTHLNFLLTPLLRLASFATHYHA